MNSWKMWRIGLRVWLVIGVVTVCFPVSAENYGVSLRMGTPGFGGEFAVGLHEQFTLRAGINYFSYSTDFEEDDFGNVADASLGLMTLPVLVDWHPFHNNFRLSAGFAYNNNRVKVEAEPGFELGLDDEDYIVDSFTGKLSFNRINPYFGIGYGNAVKQGGSLAFLMDFGVLYHGTPRVTATAVASDSTQQQALQRDLDAELDDIRDDLRTFRFYPVLTFGIVYRF